MLFNSAQFLFVFLPVVLIGYFALGRLGGVWPRVWLCMSSLAFYTVWNPAFLPVLLVSILFNFGMSQMIARAAGPARTAMLAVGVTGDLLALAYYKYALWLAGIVVGHASAVGMLGAIALPLGVSFFTFTQIGYLIDAKEGVIKERGFINYLLFVTFFPHLIAGPILHHKEIMPQFSERAIDRFDWRHFSVGTTVFMVGLFKKAVIADGVQPIVFEGFAQGAAIGTLAAWLTMLAYVIQLYFDFSGYSDMAIGLAQMFNVKFPLNFNSPYKAQNISEFWQRWHMTLTRYINAYLYNPVAVPMTRRLLAKAGDAKGALASTRGFVLTIAAPTFWTMTLAGIWHGAGLQFVIFGLLHAFYITAYRAWAAWGRKRRKFRKGEPIDLRERAEIAVAVAITLMCWLVSLVFFRSPTMRAAVIVFKALVGFGGAGVAGQGAAFGGAAIETGVLAVSFAMIWFAPNVYMIMGAESPALGKVKGDAPRWLQWQPNVRWAIAVGLIGAAAISAIGHTSEFLYFQF